MKRQLTAMLLSAMLILDVVQPVEARENVQTVDQTQDQGEDTTGLQSVEIIPTKVQIDSMKNVRYDSVSLKWIPETEENTTGFSVQRKLASASQNSWEEIADVKVGAAYEVTDKGLICGEIYSYRVVSYYMEQTETQDQNNERRIEGVPSKEKKITVRPEKSQITSVAAKNSSTIEVNWKKIAGADRYVIYRSKQKDSGFSKLKVMNGATTAYEDQKVSCGDTYYYRVRAYREEKGTYIKGALSDSKGVTVRPLTVKRPSVSSNGYNSLNVKWKRSADADGYEVYYRKLNGTEYTRGAFLRGKEQTKAVLNGLSYGQTYEVRVRAYRIIAGKKVRASMSVAQNGTPLCAAPGEITIQAGGNGKIRVSWKKVPGAQSYKIFRAESKTGAYKEIRSNVTALSYTNSNLKLGNNYYYKVCAVRKGINGALSETVKARSVEVTLVNPKINIHKGESIQLMYQAVPVPKKQVWKSADPSIASVSSTGVLTAKAVGKTTVSVRMNSVTKVYHIRVKNRLDGIDVSKWQGDIDWTRVAHSGISFTMIRAWHTFPTFADSKDTYFEKNYANARANGLKVGCYAYSKAVTVEEAVWEAKNVLKVLKNRPMDYPVVMDLEDAGVLAVTDNRTRTDMVLAFKQTIEKAGYRFALYANTDWMTHYVDNERLSKEDIWIARYRPEGHEYQGEGNVVMWQYSQTGSVDGVNGNVDLDYGYKAY